MNGPTGRVFVVVGPSGAGKDSLINYARAEFNGNAGVKFVERVITRQADLASEVHASVSHQEFDRLAAEKAFAVLWQAHNLKYGIPASTVQDTLGGVHIVVNGSRSAIPAFQAAYKSVEVVHVTASPEIRARRLAARGRETSEEVLQRLGREVTSWTTDCPVFSLDNSGELASAGLKLVQHIKAQL